MSPAHKASSPRLAPCSGPVKLVIFDCDGVLVDSEPISVAVLLDAIASAGGRVSEEEAYRRFLGRSMKTVRALLASDGVLLSPAQMDAIRAEVFRRFRGELKAIPGIADALSKLGVRFCVASSSQVERIRLSLSLTGLLEKFEPHIYSASMVERGKPAPDLFLHAARDMGAAPSACLVIEDSPAGIDAARAAGMRVFAFTGGSHAANAAHVAELALRRPDRAFADMRMLPDLIAGLSQRMP